MPETPVSKLTKSKAEAELKKLGEAIRAADEAYYQEDAPEISDADYDKLRQRLNEIEARFPELKRADSPSENVGAAPTGAFYAFPKVPERLGLTATQFVEKAIERSVLVIPGKVFSSRDTHFRLSFATDERTLGRGLDVIVELMSQG